ncbi:MAG: hypothetical protein NT038_10270 [Euryarchaeota archaeon]|nr:hypothetical protein [Euryarchaeota archaeon]
MRSTAFKHGQNTTQHLDKKRAMNTFVRIIIFLFILSFIIPSLNIQAAEPGSIYVLYPSGGSWYNGDSITISWNSYNAGSSVNIELYSSGSYYSTIVSNTWNSDSGSYNNYYWTPSGIPSGSYYQIKITSAINSTIFDYGGYFSIIERSITVTSPKGGETLIGGEMHKITWDSQNIAGYVNIYLYKGDSLIQNLAYISNSYTRSFSWYIDTSLASGSSYRIRISASSYSDIYDYSNYFTIDQRTITVTSPQQDSNWYIGETYQITWQSHLAGDTVDIKLYEKTATDIYFTSSQRLSIASSTNNDGSYMWTVPSFLPPTTPYRILIVSTTYDHAEDMSDAFNVIERDIHVTSPLSGNTWFIGEQYNITWDSKNAGDLVSLEFFREGVMETYLAVNVTNNGSFLWSIPDSFPTGTTCMIKIQSTAHPSLSGISEYFSVERKSISVSIPDDEAEIWYKEEHHRIIWVSKGTNDTVKIELFLEGVSTRMISSNTSNNGEFLWPIPADLAVNSRYQIKITSLQDERIFGFTSGYIQIENTFLQQWSGTIILFIIVSISFSLFYLFIIKKWRERIAAEATETDLQLNTRWPVRLSEEEYERIWEKNRDE